MSARRALRYLVSLPSIIPSVFPLSLSLLLNSPALVLHCMYLELNNTPPPSAIHNGREPCVHNGLHARSLLKWALLQSYICMLAKPSSLFSAIVDGGAVLISWFECGPERKHELRFWHDQPRTRWFINNAFASRDFARIDLAIYYVNFERDIASLWATRTVTNCTN